MMPGDKLIPRILRLVINAIITIVVATALLSLLMLIIGIRPYIVMTGSMEPQIPVGSICLVDRHCALQELQAGDIITYHSSPSAVVTHRVVSVGEEGAVTRGDANETVDEKAVTAEDLIGKCILTIPRIGHILQFFKSTHGIVITSVLIALLILADGLIDRFHHEDNR